MIIATFCKNRWRSALCNCDKCTAKKRGTKKISVFELKTSTVSRQASKGLSIINTSFFEIAYININMYIHGVVAWIIYLDAAAAISSVFGVKRGKRGRRRGELRGRLVDANAWLRLALHLLALHEVVRDLFVTGGPSKIKATANDSGAIVFLCSPACFVCSFVRYFGHTPGAFWDLAALPGDAFIHLAVWIGQTDSSSLKQFLASAQNCVFVRKLVAQRTWASS